MIPVFTYYMIYQSAPGNRQREADGVDDQPAEHGDDAGLLQRPAALLPARRGLPQARRWCCTSSRTCGATSSSGPAATTPPPCRSRSAPPACRSWPGCPTTWPGWPRRSSGCATATPPTCCWATTSASGAPAPTSSTPTRRTPPWTPSPRAPAASTARCGAAFDLAFAEFTDRDAGFKRTSTATGRLLVGRGGLRAPRCASWPAFVRAAAAARWCCGRSRSATPGCGRMNNTWNHYQDNKVGVAAGRSDPRPPARVPRRPGVVAFLFGRGADGATCACDANRDGVTNPAPINGNDARLAQRGRRRGLLQGAGAGLLRSGPLPLPGRRRPAPAARRPRTGARAGAGTASGCTGRRGGRSRAGRRSILAPSAPDAS